MPRTRRPPASQHRRRIGPAAAVLAVTALLAAGTSACSEDPDLTPGPPAPAQATGTPASAPATPPNGDPVVTIAATAERFAGDPGVAAFDRYVRQLDVALRAPESEESVTQLLDHTTGEATEAIRRQIQEYRDNGWTPVGTSKRDVVEVRAPDGTHRQVVSCEDDNSSYPVDSSGNPVVPVSDKWNPHEHWFILVDDTWKLNDIYRGVHECEQVS